MPRLDLAPALDWMLLDWMLQSAQVNDEMLTEALVRDYAGPLTQLAASLLPDPGQVPEVVRQTMTQAVLDRRRYSGTGSARAWLYALALNACRRRGGEMRRQRDDLQRLAAGFKLSPLETDSHLAVVTAALDPVQALALFLTLGLGLSAGELAYVLLMPIEQVEVMLDTIGRCLDQHRQHCAECTLRPGGLPEMEGRLRSAWQAAGGSLSAPDVQRLRAEILTRVSGRRRVRQALSRLPELALVGALMAATFALGWLSNRFGLKPGSGSTLSLSEPATPSQPSADWLTPTPYTPLPPPPLLSGQSSLYDVQQRAYGSLDYWRSLWADVQIIQYGVPAYGGPLQLVTRKQVWLLQPAFSRVIFGPADAEPLGTYVIFKGYEAPTSDLLIDVDLQTLFVPGELSLKKGEFRLAGKETVAGRPAIMLDWQNVDGGRISRYWVDAQTGVILRRREYADANLSTVLDEITVTDIAFDVDMPLSLFDPLAYKGDHFALDYTGAPAPAYVAPPRWRR